ncbi:hypothetical protein U6A24_12690 [Aquimarina gracilis]|uniref:C2H2-type domain-containing protein n=1 Tax=Aquimarina gracilis TaxID=874422 RepID=A0ABU5ZWW0_9FLAO|nr:hypothetical protein [Aquimarina gracilis]MEB3346327.1 hypothetical protein [Aquimarina gracilis]
MEKFLNSITIVTIAMLSIMIAFTIKEASLFYDIFEIPNPDLKLIASALFAGATSLTMLAVSVNSKLFRNQEKESKFSFPEAFAVCSLILMLIAFKVFEPEIRHWTWYFKRVFLASFLALLEYVFSKMFVRKCEQQNSSINRTLELDTLTSKFNKVQSELSRTKNELSRTKEELQKVQFPCQHCGDVLNSPSNRKRHEAKCKMNPKNQK